VAVSPRARTAIIVGSAMVIVALLLLVRNARPHDPVARLKQSETGRSGSWWFPRGGPYILGFVSTGPAELVIDGKQIVVGTGQVTQRVIYAAGAHAVTFRAPRGSRLIWHPPGRRGQPEYVPPSSLSPDPPARAHFSTAGASPGDAAIAWGILLTIAVAAFLILQRAPLSPDARRVLMAAGAVFVLALVVRAVAIGAAGQTWDEDEYWSSGRNYLVNLLSLDFRDASWRWNMEHPPVTKYLAGLGALWSDGYAPARAVFALLGAATCGLVVDVTRRLFDGALMTGVIAGVACALTPHLIAHSVIVGHETPSVFFWTLAIWLALRAQDGDQARMARGMAWAGVALGLAVGTRYTNLLLTPVVGVALLVASPKERRLRTILLGFAITIPAAAATFFAIWPRMWTGPIAHLHESWEKLKNPHGAEWYLGVHTTEPPWHYFPVYVLATAPIVLLAAAILLGAARGIAKREKGWLVVLAWIAAPFGVAWSPVRQDGVRYVLAALVPLSIAAGVGVAWLASRVPARRASEAAAIALTGYLAITCARIHPYYLDYYGEQVGGPRTVQARHLFEVGWWGEGIEEAIDWLNAHAAEDDPVYRLLEPTHLNWFREDLWRAAVSSPLTASWIVVNDAGIMKAKGFDLPPDFEPAHVVRAQGATLVTVYRRRASE
jgi:4-amino-4-deoxy-L-arabinose transferase-like glycosyltransferase